MKLLTKLKISAAGMLIASASVSCEAAADNNMNLLALLGLSSTTSDSSITVEKTEDLQADTPVYQSLVLKDNTVFKYTISEDTSASAGYKAMAVTDTDIVTLSLYNKDTGELIKTISHPVTSPQTMTYTPSSNGNYIVKVVSEAAYSSKVTAAGVISGEDVLTQTEMHNASNSAVKNISVVMAIVDNYAVCASINDYETGSPAEITDATVKITEVGASPEYKDVVIPYDNTTTDAQCNNGDFNYYLGGHDFTPGKTIQVSVVQTSENINISKEIIVPEGVSSLKLDGNESNVTIKRGADVTATWDSSKTPKAARVGLNILTNATWNSWDGKLVYADNTGSVTIPGVLTNLFTAGGTDNCIMPIAVNDVMLTDFFIGNTTVSQSGIVYLDSTTANESYCETGANLFGSAWSGDTMTVTE